MYKSNYGRTSRPSSGYRNSGGGSQRFSPNRNRGRKFGTLIDPQRFVKAAKPTEQTIYTPLHVFQDFGFHDLLNTNLQARGYNAPTQIQDMSITHALKGKDIVGIANTGTGKTAAFLLPLLNKLITQPGQKALIVAPTRELAVQIEAECRLFAKGTGFLGTLLIGGVPIVPQLRDLRDNPEIVIGTPGRIKDHLERKTLRLDNFSTIVLDEVDRMLDMGFINDITEILHNLPSNKQSLFFSATLSPTIERLIRDFTAEPVSIMAKTAETSDNVEQSVVRYAATHEKMERLHDVLLSANMEKALIFGETKRSVEKLSLDLISRGFVAEAMHGNKTQQQRQRSLNKFRDGQINVLVATDVAARGIDVDGITHVVNFDVPHTYDDYTHRIGRAGRAGKIGYAVTFVSN